MRGCCCSVVGDARLQRPVLNPRDAQMADRQSPSHQHGAPFRALDLGGLGFNSK